MGEARTFLGESPDERRLRRRETLIDAAYDLLHEGGLVAIGVRSVSQRAGLNTRYFYESFASVDEMMLVMLQSLFAEVLLRGMTALHEPALGDVDHVTDEDLLERFRRGLGVAMSVALDDPRKLALIASVNAGAGAVSQEMRRQVLNAADIIAADSDAQLVNVDRAAALFMTGGIVEVALAYASGDLPLSRQELIERMAQISLGAVTVTRARSKRGAKK